jgi:amino acid transporter
MIITTVTNVLGPVGGDIAQVLLMTSLFAAALSFHNVLARYYFALGNSGALHRACGRSHPKHRSPHVASATQTVVAAAFIIVFALAGMDPVTQVFAWMAGTATLGVLALMALTSVAVLVFFRRSRADTRVWHTLVAPALGLLGLLGAVLVLAFVLGVVWSLRRPSVLPDPADPAAQPTAPAA